MKLKIIVSTVLWMGVIFYSPILNALATRSFQEGVHHPGTGPSFQYKIIQAPNHTWGYDILRDNKIFIHQPNRPGLPGMEGFVTKKDAVKVAQLVIKKIKRGEMPPTVSEEEMRGLKMGN